MSTARSVRYNQTDGRKSRSRKRLRVAFCLSILTLTAMLGPSYNSLVAAQTGYYSREFKWSYQGFEWTFGLDIPKALYEIYQKVPASTRLLHQSSGYGFLTTTNDPYLQKVATELKEASSQKGYDSFDEVSFVLAFIQSLPYTSDSVTSKYDEYPRFPLETLVDNGGDCEDTAILFATITLIMGYGTVYLNPPDHYAVGILGDNISGFYFTYNNKTYYYCETTGEGWKIGEVPQEHKTTQAYVFPINENQQYNALAHYSPELPSQTATGIISSSPNPTPAESSSVQFDFFGEIEILVVISAVSILAIICALFVLLRGIKKAPSK